MPEKREWTIYRTGKPSTKENWTNPDCQEFEELTHVAHISHAIQIMNDGFIKASLIRDKSKLNKQRILVSWLSPNYWTNGSRYGTVEFNFDFKKLIKGYKYYWVEAITTYSPHACRVLVTSKNYDGILVPYKPEKDDGPWHYDAKTKTHYRNSEYCLEFMFEDDIDLEDCLSICFIKHHPSMCCLNVSKCPELKSSSSKAGSIFLAKIIAENMDINPTLFYSDDSKRFPSDSMKNAIWELCRVVENVKSDSDNEAIRFKSDDKNSQIIAKAIFYYFSIQEKSSWQGLVQMFETRSELIEMLLDIIIAKFKFSDKFKRRMLIELEE